MNRYLGTKTKILPELYEEITKVAGKDTPTVCDIFSGSLAVSLFLKRRGCQVAANDINDLSYVYGVAFLRYSTIPKYPLKKMLQNLNHNEYGEICDHAEALLEEERTRFDAENVYGEFRDWPDFRRKMLSTAKVISHLQLWEGGTGRKSFDRNDVVDCYTIHGTRANYASVRGRKGKRNFFNLHNAKVIDRALNHIRWWYRTGVISEHQRCTLISILLDSMERCVNCQGTYHDFPRNQLETRARKRIVFRLPNYYGLLHTKKRSFIGQAEDSLEFIKRAPRHDVLYIDPPYNFRQYTAYYFLPNFFAIHSTLPNLERFLSKIQYVRGQNMEHDFVSTFSNRGKFLRSLKELICSAKTKHVVLSYFDGVNHWNRFLEDDNSKGFHRLSDFFADKAIFRKGRSRVVPVDRINYQSQNGHKAKTVQEFLFIGTKV